MKAEESNLKCRESHGAPPGALAPGQINRARSPAHQLNEGESWSATGRQRRPDKSTGVRSPAYWAELREGHGAPPGANGARTNQQACGRPRIEL